MGFQDFAAGSFARNPACGVAALGFLCGADLAFAQSSRETEETPSFAFDVVYTGDIWTNTHGGLAKDEKYLDNLDVTLSIDAEQAFGLTGGTFFFYVLSNNSTTLSDTVLGDLQVASNIDTGYATRLYEAWYEQVFADGRGALKVGLYDLNSEFDAMDTAGLFLSSSHGIGPDFSQSGENGPSIFPSASLAARLQYQITDSVLVRAAIFDGVPGDPNRPRRTAIKLGNGDGALLAAEVEADLDGTIATVGGWHYTSKFDEQLAIDPATLGPKQSNGNSGIYVEAERQVTSPFGDARGLSMFGRFGIANGKINQLSRYAGGGLAYTGLFDARPDDVAGFAIAHAVNGDTFRTLQTAAGTPVDKAETSFEFTYRAQLTDWLAIQPDVQWIVNPGTDPTLKDAVAIGLRFEVGFGVSR
ncbi:MAG: carbohydrate porin [Rhodobacteraceae bacterium]|nr:carbohydrate porin [Paracoccaceae bacterium]